MADDKGYYVFWGYPKELKTDQQYTYKMSTTGGDMTGVTYEFKWEFTCDGVTTKETIASGLTSLTYAWTPTSVKFGPLMKKSKSGTLKLIVTTSTGKMTYSTELPLTISDSIKPSISGITVTRTNGFNDRSVSNITSHKLSFNVAGLYGATQSVTVEIGANKYTKSVNAVAGNAVTKVEFDIGIFDAGTSDIYVKSVWIQVADSRGNTAKTSTSIDIYKYTRPTVETSVYRNANEEAYIAFTPTIQTTVAGKANSTSLFYARSILGESVVQTDLKTSPQKLNGADDISKSYNVFVFLKDAVGGIAVARLVLPSNIPVIDIGSDGKTVTFFGASPTTATVESVNICDSMHIKKDAINICDLLHISPEKINLINADMYSDSNGVQITPYDISILDKNNIHGVHIELMKKAQVIPDEYIYGGRIGLGCYYNSGQPIDSPSLVIESNNMYTNFDSSNSVITKIITGTMTEITAKAVNATVENRFILRCADTLNDGSNIQFYTTSLDIADRTGHLGVELYRDGEGGQINIYPPNPSTYWAMDAYDTNFRFYYWNGSTAIGPLSLTTDGNVVIYNLLSGNKATFNDYVAAKRFGAINVAWNVSCNALYCQWADNANHNLVTRNRDGLGSAFGWVGSSSYASVTTVRGRTCKVQNASGTTTLSDERLKDDFQSLDKWEGFFDNLEPCAFKLKGGSSGRYHFGFKAQQVKESLEKAGLTTKDFAGFVTTKYVVDEEDPETTELYEQLGIKPGDDVHGLIYTEFVALQHNEIQKLKERVKNLETEINALKQ